MAQTAKQYSYTSAYAYIYSDISVTHVAGSTNVTVSATSHMYSGGSSYSGITRYMCLVINGTTYYNCGSRSGSFSSQTTYNSWISGSKTINVGTYGSGSLTVGVYISASSTSLSSSGTFIWNGSTNTKTSDCSLKTVTVSYGASATKVGAPSSVSSTAYVKQNSNVTVSWGAASGGQNNPVAYYRVWYRFSSGSGWGSWVLWKDQISSSSRSYTGALSSLGTWQFDVVAVSTISALGNSETYASNYTYTWSNVSNPSNFRVTGGTQGTSSYQTGNFYLSWNAASAGTNNSVSYYTVDGSSASSGSGARSVTAGSSKTYTLKAVGARGDVSSGITCTVYNPTLTFSKTVTLNYSNIYTTGLKVSWTAATKTAASGLSIRYRIYRQVDGGTQKDLGTVTGTSYTVPESTTDIPYGSTVRYWVRAELYDSSYTYRTVDSSWSATIRRGYLPGVVTSIKFDNEWYLSESNTRWAYGGTTYNPDLANFSNFTVTNSSNSTYEYQDEVDSTQGIYHYFTFGKHTKITVTIPPSSLIADDGGTETLTLKGYNGDTVVWTNTTSGIERHTSSATYNFIPGQYITKLEAKLVNVYSGSNVETSNTNKSWIIQKLKVPTVLTLSNDSLYKPIIDNFGEINYNCIVNDGGSFQKTISRVILAVNAPWVTNTGSWNVNNGFRIDVSDDNSTWKQIALQSGDVTHNIGQSTGSGTYLNNFYFPLYTDTGDTSSRVNQPLTFNIALIKTGEETESFSHWLPDTIDLKTENVDNLTLYYRITPINKYLYADEATESEYMGGAVILSTSMDTKTELTFPVAPSILTNGAPLSDISFGESGTIKGRVLNNGSEIERVNYKSYLIFDFYAGFNSNQFYEVVNNENQARYIGNNGVYYLKEGYSDPCHYQITFFTCIDEDTPTWNKKYEGITLNKYNQPFEDNILLYDSGYTPYISSIIIGGTSYNIIKYRGWYKLNLSDPTIDEFVQVGLRPFLVNNKYYAFPAQIIDSTSDGRWRMHDDYGNVNNFARIWVASTQNPKLTISSVERIQNDNEAINISYKILPQGTGSTYRFGTSQNNVLRPYTPSDQELRVDFKCQQSDGTSSDFFGTHKINISSLNSMQDNIIQLRTIYTQLTAAATWAENTYYEKINDIYVLLREDPGDLETNYAHYYTAYVIGVPIETVSPQGELGIKIIGSLSDSQSYTFLIYGDILGTQYNAVKNGISNLPDYSE